MTNGHLYWASGPHFPLAEGLWLAHTCVSCALGWQYASGLAICCHHYKLHVSFFSPTVKQTIVFHKLEQNLTFGLIGSTETNHCSQYNIRRCLV